MLGPGHGIPRVRSTAPRAPGWQVGSTISIGDDAFGGRGPARDHVVFSDSMIADGWHSPHTAQPCPKTQRNRPQSTTQRPLEPTLPNDLVTPYRHVPWAAKRRLAIWLPSANGPMGVEVRPITGGALSGRGDDEIPCRVPDLGDADAFVVSSAAVRLGIRTHVPLSPPFGTFPGIAGGRQREERDQRVRQNGTVGR